MALLDFEDAAEILMMHHRIVWEFLKGEWLSEDGWRSFVFEEESYYYLNLPAYSQYEFPHQYSYIENGDFMSYDSDEDTAVAFFTFDIIDANTMNVYCHKDGSTVTLYRKSAELILGTDDTHSL